MLLYSSQQGSVIGSSQPKYRKSPSRRGKSRWEPIPEEKLAEKLASVSYDPVKDASWDRLRERERTVSWFFFFFLKVLVLCDNIFGGICFGWLHECF